MDHKKEHIIEIGKDLFIEKGYLNTSMQDIAEACNISKATLYKLFRSKEDLSLAVISYMVSQMMCDVESILSQNELSKPDIFKTCLLRRMTDASKRMRFMDEFLFAQPIAQREKYLVSINKLHLDIFILFQQIIMKTFDLKDDLLASELTLSLNGFLKEISYISWSGKLQPEHEAVVEYITDSLRATIDIRKKKKTFLTRNILDLANRLYTCNNPESMKPVFQRRSLMRSLRSVLESYEKNGGDAKLKEAEEILNELKTIDYESGDNK